MGAHDGEGREAQSSSTAARTSGASGDEARVVRPALLGLLVFAIAIAAFTASIADAWIYDDRPLIEDNRWIHGFGHVRHWFSTDFWDVSEEFKRFGIRIVYFRPLVTASYALDWAIGRGSPVWFHVINLLLHGAASWLVFRALSRWIGDARAAFVAAVIWAVHPTKAEAVAWISGRTDPLCTLGIFVALEGVAAMARGRRGLGIALQLAGTAFAFLCKEQAIVMAALVAVEVWAARGRPALDASSIGAALRPSLAYAALALAYLAFRTRFLPMTSPAGARLPFDYRLIAAVETYGRNVVLAAVPWRLTVQQGAVVSSGGKLLHVWGYVAIGAGAIAALFTSAWWCRRRLPGVSLGILLFLGMLLPTSNLVPTGMNVLVADRFLYLPAVGLALAIGTLLVRAKVAAPWVVAGIYATLLFARSERRSFDYQSEKQFWTTEYQTDASNIEALRYFEQRAANKRELRRALVLLGEMHRLTNTRFLHTGHAVEYMIEAVRLVLTLTPDHDRPTLAAVSAFCRDAIDERATTAKLATPIASFELPLSGANRGGAMRMRPRLATCSALAESRLGNDELAVALAAKAYEECPQCESAARDDAMVFARAGRYREAAKVLSGLESQGADVAMQRQTLARAEALGRQALDPAAPESLRTLARAEELSVLEAWGRAYAVLAPHRSEFADIPEVARSFAELSYRAGEEPVARETLSHLGDAPAQIDAQEAEWAKRLGWQ
jgi:hypothetical protein